MTAPSLRSELAASVRRVNLVYIEAGKPEVDLGDLRSLEDAIDQAVATGDRANAEATIARWEREVRERIRGAS